MNEQNQNNTTIVIRQVPTDISNIRNFYEYEKIQINSRDEYESAAGYFLNIKAHLKKAEEERIKITGPINQALRSTNDLFKKFTDPLHSIKRGLENKMRVFADMDRKKLEETERKKREEDKKRFEEEVKKAKKEAIELESETALESAKRFQKRADSIDDKNIQVKQTVRLGDSGTMAERRIWKARIIDPLLVPREYLIVDEKRLNKEARHFGEEGNKIPGVEFYQETSFSATPR